MKYIFLLLIFLTACSKDAVLDRAENNDVSAEIISQDHKFGRDLKIKAKGNEFIIDVEELKAWKVDFCNVDGGEMELALGVYKKTPFDPKFDRRCFLYNIDFKNRKLKPKLRISRLYNPIVDFNLCKVLKAEPKFLDKEKKVEIAGSERELYLEGDEIKWK